MPSVSIGSSVWRSPAVSMNLKVYGPMSAVSSMVSRVVPGMSLTMARSCRSRALSSEDLPALGSPTIATGIPRRSAVPAENVSASRSTVSRVARVRSARRSRGANVTSSSLKSSSSSSSDASSSSCWRNDSMCRANWPLSCLMARRWAAADDAAIISATASACVRSMRPLEKARRVNSPGSAMRAPAATSSRSSSDWMYVEPCTAISTTSSPVKLCGERNMVATAWSSGRLLSGFTICPR